jgi:hypothetical protein
MFVPLLFFSDACTECIVDSDPHPLELPGAQVMIRLLCFAISGVNVILLGPNLSSG